MSERDPDGGWSNRKFLSEIVDLTPFTAQEQEYIKLYQAHYSKYMELNVFFYGSTEQRLRRDDPKYEEVYAEYQSIEKELTSLENSTHLARVLKVIYEEKKAELTRRGEEALEEQRRRDQEYIEEFTKKWAASNIKDISPTPPSSQKKARIKSFLSTYKKVIIILLIISFAFTIVGLIGYNISAGNMRSALNHYDYTFEKCHTAGCGDSNCEYCLGMEKQVSQFTNSYGGPYEFPYYSDVSNIRTTFEVIGVISLILTGIFLISFFVIIVYSRKDNIIVKQHSSQFGNNKRKNKFCRYCGAEINEDSCFCSSCGKKLI